MHTKHSDRPVYTAHPHYKAGKIMINKIRLSFSAIALIVLLALPAMLSAQTITSSIKGTVLDQTGSVVAGASVEVVDLRNGNTRNLTTNETGTFLAARLSAGGPYQVTINGTKTVTVDSLDVGDIYNLTIAMQQALVISTI
jgi:type 1 fimbria pilin